MTFKERLQQIELAERQAAEPQRPLAPRPEMEVQDEPDEAHLSGTGEGTTVRCSECGHNTFREEHSAIMCSTCSHGPFCNYCWEVHIREFHPLLADSYNDARRGIRRKARFLNHYLIRTVVKPAGFGLGLAALLLVAYFAYRDRQPADEPVVRELTGAAPSVDAARSARANTEPNARLGAATTDLAEAASAASRLVTPPAGTPPTVPVDSSMSARTPPLATGSVEGMGNPRATASANGSLVIELAAVTSPVHRGSDAHLQIHTAPGAACTIEVRYRSGPSKARALGPQAADAAGQVTWTWRIGGQTTLGAWPVTVSCTLGDTQGSSSTSITLVE